MAPRAFEHADEDVGATTLFAYTSYLALPVAKDVFEKRRK